MSVVYCTGDVESWKAKHAASETKCTDLAAQMDKVAAFDALHEQKMELEALLAAAVVRLERVMNATYQAAKYKDQVRASKSHKTRDKSTSYSPLHQSWALQFLLLDCYHKAWTYFCHQ